MIYCLYKCVVPKNLEKVFCVPTCGPTCVTLTGWPDQNHQSGEALPEWECWEPSCHLHRKSAAAEGEREEKGVKVSHRGSYEYHDVNSQPFDVTHRAARHTGSKSAH